MPTLISVASARLLSRTVLPSVSTLIAVPAAAATTAAAASSLLPSPAASVTPLSGLSNCGGGGGGGGGGVGGGGGDSHGVGDVKLKTREAADAHPLPFDALSAAHRQGNYCDCFSTFFRWLGAGSRLRFRQLFDLFYWLLLLFPMSLAIGSACGIFLYCIDLVTHWRFDQFWLLFLLPVVGVLQASAYYMWGARVSAGVNMIIDQIHEPNKSKGRASIPTRMAPLVFIGTVLTHLCGGSAGREGTALQMAGAISTLYLRLLRTASCGRISFTSSATRTVAIASLAAGFSGVFGTPFAGVVFAMEVLSIGQLSTEAMVPSLFASIIANWCTRRWLDLFQMQHTEYVVVWLTLTDVNSAGVVMMLKICVASIFYGLAAYLFSTGVEQVKHINSKITPKNRPYLTPVLGGCLVIALTYIVGTRSYDGLGTLNLPDYSLTTISTAFSAGGAPLFAWLWKLIFTIITLGSGYKGGEVTCLFYIGATFGTTMAAMLQETAHTDMFAAVGFVAVFAGASNTPLASTLMGVELFGPGAVQIIYLAIGCYISFLVSGFSGIYGSQLVKAEKIQAGIGSSYTAASHQCVSNVSVDIPSSVVPISMQKLIDDENDMISGRDMRFITMARQSIASIQEVSAADLVPIAAPLIFPIRSGSGLNLQSQQYVVPATVAIVRSQSQRSEAFETQQRRSSPNPADGINQSAGYGQVHEVASTSSPRISVGYQTLREGDE